MGISRQPMKKKCKKNLELSFKHGGLSIARPSQRTYTPSDQIQVISDQCVSLPLPQRMHDIGKNHGG